MLRNIFLKKNPDVIFCEKKPRKIKDFGHEESVGFALSPGAHRPVGAGRVGGETDRYKEKKMNHYSGSDLFCL